MGVSKAIVGCMQKRKPIAGAIQTQSTQPGRD